MYLIYITPSLAHFKHANLQYPIVEQNYLTQSLICNKVFQISQKNAGNSTNNYVPSQSTQSCGYQYLERIILCISSLGKGQNSGFKYYFCRMDITFVSS